MRLLLSFLFIFQATLAHGATPIAEKLLGYKEFIALPMPGDVLTRIKSSATAVFPIGNSKALPACSAVIVSNSGYVLTDFHCLLNKSAGANGEINGLSPKAEFSRAKVIARGKGTYTQFPKSNSAGFNFAKFNDGFDDWALLKLPERSGGYACNTVSNDSVEGASVYHLGFPQEYTMQNSWLRAMLDPDHHEFKDKVGGQLRKKLAMELQSSLQRGEPWAVNVAYPLYISLGLAFKTVAAAARRMPMMNEQSDLDKVIDLNNYAFSTAPIHVGMSGGGVFNLDNGQLMGLNVFTFGNVKLSYVGFAYGIGYIKVPYIKEMIRKKLGDKTLAEAFDCKPSNKSPVHFIAQE